MTYQEKLKDPKWQKRRLEILQRDMWCCQICNNENDTLNIHHFQYRKGLEPWEYEDDELITLCEGHHGFISRHKIPKELITLWVENKSKLSSSNLVDLFEEFIGGVCSYFYNTDIRKTLVTTVTK